MGLSTFPVHLLREGHGCPGDVRPPDRAVQVAPAAGLTGFAPPVGVIDPLVRSSTPRPRHAPVRHGRGLKVTARPPVDTTAPRVIPFYALTIGPPRGRDGIG